MTNLAHSVESRNGFPLARLGTVGNSYRYGSCRLGDRPPVERMAALYPGFHQAGRSDDQIGGSAMSEINTTKAVAVVGSSQ